jgi:hypothetical protein
LGEGVKGDGPEAAMSDPTKHHDEPDDLDLDAETVADLEPDDAADAAGGLLARTTTGGATDTCFCTLTCLACPAAY